MNWKVKIISEDCPYRIYPTHTINNKWQKGYCSLPEDDDKDIECKKENCPIKED